MFYNRIEDCAGKSKNNPNVETYIWMFCIWTAKQINSEIWWNFNGYIIFSSFWTCINSSQCFVGIVLLNLCSVLWITFSPFVLFYCCHCIVCFSIYVCFCLTFCFLQALHTFWIMHSCYNKMKHRKLHTVRTFPKWIIKMVEWGKIDTPNTQIHDNSLSWLGTGTFIKMWRGWTSFICFCVVKWRCFLWLVNMSFTLFF